MSGEDIFRRAFAFSMREEGGDAYTDDPRDPGGPTKYGVALRYNRECIPDKDGDGDIDADDVKLLEEADALTLYRERYWTPAGCDALPGALAFMYADMVYNPGPGAAPRLLQRACNELGAALSVDGRPGPRTLEAIRGLERAGRLEELLTALADERLRYYQSRRGWPTYGRGWTARTRRCLEEARRLPRGGAA